MEVPTLFCGPTGTGKSIYIKNLLLSLSRDEFMTIVLFVFISKTKRKITVKK